MCPFLKWKEFKECLKQSGMNVHIDEAVQKQNFMYQRLDWEVVMQKFKNNPHSGIA